jgi:hypothetical protein
MGMRKHFVDGTRRYVLIVLASTAILAALCAIPLFYFLQVWIASTILLLIVLAVPLIIAAAFRLGLPWFVGKAARVLIESEASSAYKIETKSISQKELAKVLEQLATLSEKPSQSLPPPPPPPSASSDPNPLPRPLDTQIEDQPRVLKRAVSSRVRAKNILSWLKTKRRQPTAAASSKHDIDPDDRQTEIKLINPRSDKEWDVKRPIWAGISWAIDISIKPPSEVGGLAARDGREPLAMRRLGKAVDLLIKVSDSSGGDVLLQAIEDPFQTLLLPVDGPSRTRRVSFMPVIINGGGLAPRKARLTVQIFYRPNLIDAIDIELSVVPHDPVFAKVPPAAGPDDAHFIRYRDEKAEDSRALGWLGEDIAPRALTIYARKDDQRMHLDFTLVRSEGRTLQLSAISVIPPNDLLSLLLDVREAYSQLNLDIFGGETGDKHLYETGIERLAKLGHRAWTLLFNNNDAKTSLLAIGDYLKSVGLAPDSIVQIVLKDSISDFIFPWSILYDGEYPNSKHPARWQSFWGARYQIEQFVGRSDSIRPLAPAYVDVAFLPWDSFPETNLVREALGLMASPPRIEVLGECTNRASLVEAIKSDRANFYCFFCHGHTRAPEDPAFGNLIRRQLQIIQDKEAGLAAANDGPPNERQTAMRQFIVSMKALLTSSLTAKDHLISLSDEDVGYQDLVGEVGRSRFETQPVLFLDMCQSAQLFPGVNESFVALFLKLQASTVIGTECEISPALGRAFAEKFMEAMFQNGRSAGEALLDAREALAGQGNPLGLVYTLYGRATRTLVLKSTSGAAVHKLRGGIDVHTTN